MILEHIDSPADLRPLTPEELTILAEEIRGFIVDAVTATGGHLGSNLGVVELTLALHRTSRGESNVRWRARVSSTTPRLEPRWPPVALSLIHISEPTRPY